MNPFPQDLQLKTISQTKRLVNIIPTAQNEELSILEKNHVRRKSRRNSFGFEEDSESSSISDTIDSPKSFSGVKLFLTIDPMPFFSDIKEIGSGLTSEVYMVKYKSKNVAAKRIKMTHKQKEYIINEIQVMNSVKSRYLVGLISAYLYNETAWILMKYMNAGTLGNLIKFVKCDEGAIAFFASRILFGLKRLHDNNIIHRDIKCENIFLTNKGRVKIGDFGFACYLNNLSNEESEYLVGSPYWMAPEVARGENHSKASDIWALGISCIEMFLGKPPYSSMEPLKAIKYIGKHGTKIPSGISEDFADFLNQCTKKNPNDRPSVSKLLKHPFLKMKFQRKMIVPYISKGLQYSEDSELFGF